MHHRILELYSGIGGMHCAWNESGKKGTIIAAIDINTVANEVYKHNFPETKLLTRNIQALSLQELKNINADTILMSPPCQPFSRNGKFLDASDPRTQSFIFILEMLEQLKSVQYILMENVKGFESSSVRNMFKEALDKCGFQFQEFLLCPSSVGVPNSRLRYYCIARRSYLDWNFTPTDDIYWVDYKAKIKGRVAALRSSQRRTGGGPSTEKPLTEIEQKFLLVLGEDFGQGLSGVQVDPFTEMLELGRDYDNPYKLEKILDPDEQEFVVPENLLKRAYLLDICYKDSPRSCCFTKAYSHYVEGTGSVFTQATPETVQKCFESANNFERGSEDFLACLRPLKLRFFTPKEVLALMCFPVNYSFPNHITRKQCYRLLGNSVNVKVISELIKILYYNK